MENSNLTKALKQQNLLQSFLTAHPQGCVDLEPSLTRTFATPVKTLIFKNAKKISAPKLNTFLQTVRLLQPFDDSILNISLFYLNRYLLMADDHIREIEGFTVLVLASILRLISKVHMEKKLRKKDSKVLFKTLGPMLNQVELFVFTQLMDSSLVVLKQEYSLLSNRINLMLG